MLDSGRSCMSINRYLFTWTAATERRLTSGRRMTVIGVWLTKQMAVDFRHP
jgi:hypothetical protein